MLAFGCSELFSPLDSLNTSTKSLFDLLKTENTELIKVHKDVFKCLDALADTAGNVDASDVELIKLKAQVDAQDDIKKSILDCLAHLYKKVDNMPKATYKPCPRKFECDFSDAPFAGPDRECLYRLEKKVGDMSTKVSRVGSAMKKLYSLLPSVDEGRNLGEQSGPAEGEQRKYKGKKIMTLEEEVIDAKRKKVGKRVKASISDVLKLKAPLSFIVELSISKDEDKEALKT
ncbi:hypothetical protein L6452_05362 [Arctium lappa]|uniref:Uncharacterized protein n=1 Tax=Arctium lappa TaxID=4217 RepID=A0ACB9EFU8_ARCLA|nr:hypothetical protein L6452_05362 [Arctium lappa]